MTDNLMGDTMRLKAFVAAAALTGLLLWQSASASAADMTAEKFRLICRLFIQWEGYEPPPNWVKNGDAAFCAGVFGAIFDYTDAIRPEYRSFCLPTEVTISTLAKVFHKFLEEYPELAHHNYMVVVFVAFARAYPCQKQGVTAPDIR